PSRETPVRCPLAAALDQRSCCHTPTMCAGSRGSTATFGSTTLLGKFFAGGCDCVQPRAKPLGPETRTGALTTGPVCATAVCWRAAESSSGSRRSSRRHPALSRPEHRPPVFSDEGVL